MFILYHAHIASLLPREYPFSHKLSQILDMLHTSHSGESSSPEACLRALILNVYLHAEEVSSFSTTASRREEH
jgi:hypothetical protein